MSADVNWGVLSFVIIFPIIYNIQLAFNRRELALHYMSSLKSYISNIFINCRIYKWNHQKTGYINEHCNNLKAIFFDIIENITE